jgi:membrane-anchored mycosin MYCP
MNRLLPGSRVAAALVLGVALISPASPAQAAPATCNVKLGGPEPGDVPWAQTRLGFDRAWTVTQGAGVTVAVIDSGVNTEQSQMRLIHYVPGANVIAGAGPTDTRDCVGHGTAVAGIVAAPQVRTIAFTGVAPKASIMPIKVTDQNQGIAPQAIADAIDAAIAAHVGVINISIATSSDVASLRQAIDRAEAHDVVVVAAASDDGANANQTAYPAAYPTVLAVAASDRQDAVANFSGTGRYIDLAAPGVKVETPAPKSGYLPQDGTSFAAPYVSGAAALVRAAHPQLTAAQVRARLEATADPPPGLTVPSPQYGYGIVNPYLAVTAVRDDSAAAPPPAKPQAIAPPPPRVIPDRHLQHVALAVGVALLGLAILAWLGAAVVRRGSWFGRPPARAGTREESLVP